MEKLLLRPVEAADAIGIGRSKVYELLASGELPSIRIGASVRVPVDALKAWIAARTAAGREA
jgi:excisionase family DNA binding protein